MGETFTARLLRYLGGLRPRDPRSALTGRIASIEALQYDADDVDEAAAAVNVVAFAAIALGLPPDRARDAVAGWIVALEHTSPIFRTQEGTAALGRFYNRELRRLRDRVHAGRVVPGRMRSPEAFERLSELADQGACDGALVWLCAQVLAPTEPGSCYAHNLNGQKRWRAPHRACPQAQRPGLRRTN